MKNNKILVAIAFFAVTIITNSSYSQENEINEIGNVGVRLINLSAVL